jgi:Heterokaryon incompatibility protein (HET)
VSEYPGSREALNRIVKWVKDCEEHPDCQPPRSPLPTRVLDVGDGSNTGPIRLFESRDTTHERYIALSHCWGKSQLPTTTTINISQRRTAINFEELSKSFQDAVVVTRTMAVRYLWIDSLCICQDDLRDWEREAAKMASVYSNAYLTISATGAKDGTLGCFLHRGTKEYVTITCDNKNGIKGDLLAFTLQLEKEAKSQLYIEMDTEPLSERGWCFQERVLSRRILHFASDQMYYECMDGFRGEEGVYLPNRYDSVHGYVGSYPSHRHHASTTNRDLDQWHNFLCGYGPRKLTKGSDKLPALSGIAEVFSKRLGDRYVAGLWQNSMIEGLLWQGMQLQNAPESRAPSWSWASVDGICATGLLGRWEPLATVIDLNVELEGENPYGAVKSGWIKLEAPLLPLFLAGNEEKDEDEEEDEEKEEDEDEDEEKEEEGDEDEDEEGDEEEHQEKGEEAGEECLEQEYQWEDEAQSGGDDNGDTAKGGEPSDRRRIYLRTKRGDRKGAFAYFDLTNSGYGEVLSLARANQIFALVLAVDVGESDGRLMNYHSLLVTPTGGDADKSMKRVGLILQEIVSLGIDETRSSRTIVTLV